MKILATILITILVLATAAIGVAIFWVDTASFKTQIENAVENATGKPLQIEGIPEISIFPLGFKIGTAFWGYRDGKPSQYGISVAIKSSSLSIELIPLFSKNVVVNSISLVEPKINIFSEKPTKATPEAQIESVPLDNKTENFAIELKKMSIKNASLLIKNVQDMNIEVNGLNVNINDLKPNELGTIKINTNINLEQVDDKQILFAGHVDLKTSLMFNENKIDVKKAKINITAQKSTLIKLSEPLKIDASGVYFIKTKHLELGNIAINSKHATFTLNNKITAASLKNMHGSQKVNAVHKEKVDKNRLIEDKMTLKADKKELIADKNEFLGDFTLQANLVEVLKMLQINIPNKQIPKDLNLVGILNYDKNNIYLKDIKGKIDNTTLTAYLNVLSFDAKEEMSIMGKFNLDKINVDKYLNLPAKASTKKASNKQNSKHDVNKNFDKEANIVMPKGLPNMNLEFNIESLSVQSIVLKKIHAIIRSKSGIYKLQPLKFALATGGKFSSSVAGNSKNNSYHINILADGINVDNFLQAFHGSSKVSGFAYLNTDMKTAGTNISKLKANLSGKGQFIMKNIALNNMSFIPQNILGKNTIPTKFDELSAHFVSKKGIITAKPIKLLEKKSSKTQKFGGLGQAIINLPAENIKLSMDLKLDKLTLPLSISGPFTNLSYVLDTSKMVEQVIKSGILESLTKDLPKTNPLRNLFKGFMGE